MITIKLSEAEAKLCAQNIDGWLDAGACEGGLEPDEKAALCKLYYQCTSTKKRRAPKAYLAPTQGADARPETIYQVNEGCVRTGDLWRDVAEASYAPLLARGYQGRIVYATRDATPSDDFRESVTQLVDDMLTAWIADLPISACGEISARANALLAARAASAPREKT